ncbi:MAG: hypothetical protein AB7G08_28565 [Hyphomicrobiaceae bacterium]
MYVYLDTHYIEMRRVADLLAREEGYRPVFMFAYRYDAVETDIQASVGAGYECIGPKGEPISGSSVGVDAAGNQSSSAQRGLWARLLDRITSRLPSRLRRFVGSMRSVPPLQRALSGIFPRLGLYVEHLKSQEALAERIVAAVSPAIVVLPEDNIDYLTGALIRAARRRGIGTLIVPYTLANAEEIAEAYWHNEDYTLARWQNRIAGYLYPRWVYEHRGRRLIPLPADRIVATELLGLSPPLPWIINSGDAHAIAVEGPFMRQYYLEAGLPEEKLVVTGALYDDVLHAQMKDARARARDVRVELGVDPDRPLLLCALPPNQYRSGRPGAEFPTYEAMIRAWASLLLEADAFSVVVKLHPRTLRSEVPYLEQDYGLRLSSVDTAALIPHCDLYVASVSATIRLAVASGKPVINYDSYRFRYRDFSSVPGIITVEDAREFSAALRKLADPYVRGSMARRQREFADSANIIDGKAGQRLLGLINSLARR